MLEVHGIHCRAHHVRAKRCRCLGYENAFLEMPIEHLPMSTDLKKSLREFGLRTM